MNDDKTIEKFEAWGLLELFGHQRLAGKLSDQTIGGVHFLRIDVPAVGDVPPLGLCSSEVLGPKVEKRDGRREPDA